MTRKIGTEGQSAIPKDLRDQAKLEPVEVGVAGRRASRRWPLRGRFAAGGMAARLLEERDQEPR